MVELEPVEIELWFQLGGTLEHINAKVQKKKKKTRAKDVAALKLLYSANVRRENQRRVKPNSERKKKRV